MSISELKRVHFVGIGGIGTSALAKFFSSRGVKVSGSDVKESPITLLLKERDIFVSIGHDASNITTDIDMVIYSPACPEDDPELAEARKKGIPTHTYPEALGFAMQGFDGVAVSGTNGKTTTTALLGKMLEKGGLDPTVIVGGQVPDWDGNLRVGKGKIFLAEGCEYRRQMLNLHPNTVVLTNIEADHLDYYKDLDDIKSAFEMYVQSLPKHGKIIYNVDDVNVCDVLQSMTDITKVSFGVDSTADLTASNIQIGSGVQTFLMTWKGEGLGEVSLHIPGRFNIENALAATATALTLGVTFDDIKSALGEFGGTWRRFQRVGVRDGVIIISDYAHHPTALSGTIDGAKSFFPDKKILLVFQPHHRERTQKLFNEFVGALSNVGDVLIPQIYDVAGRESAKNTVSSEDLVNAVKKNGGSDKVLYTGSLTETKKVIVENIKNFDVVLLMGAGDTHSLAEELVNK